MLVIICAKITRRANRQVLGGYVSVEQIDSGILKELVCFNFYCGWRGISEFYKNYLPDGVSAQQTYILELCDLDNGVLVGQLAKALEIDDSAISSMLRRMESAALIKRLVSPANRRQTLVFLTLQGFELRENIRSVMEKADEKLREVIPQSKINELISTVELLRKLNSSQV